MHSCICYHRSMHHRMVHIFILRLSAWPFSGLVSVAESPPICFTPTLWLSWNLPIGFFLRHVLKTPWNFGKNFSNPLHYWGFPFLFFFARHVYGGNSESGRKFSITGNSRASCWGFPSARSSRRSPILSLDCWYPPTCLAAFSSGSSSLVLHAFFGCLQNSQKDCFALVRSVLVSLLPASCFHRIVKDKILTGCISSLQQEFWWCCIPSYSTRRRG